MRNKTPGGHRDIFRLACFVNRFYCKKYTVKALLYLRTQIENFDRKFHFFYFKVFLRNLQFSVKEIDKRTNYLFSTELCWKDGFKNLISLLGYRSFATSTFASTTIATRLFASSGKTDRCHFD